MLSWFVFYESALWEGHQDSTGTFDPMSTNWVPNASLDAKDAIVNTTKRSCLPRAYILVERKQPIKVKTIHKTVSHSDKVMKKINRVMGENILNTIVRKGLCGMT